MRDFEEMLNQESEEKDKPEGSSASEKKDESREKPGQDSGFNSQLTKQLEAQTRRNEQLTEVLRNIVGSKSQQLEKDDQDDEDIFGLSFDSDEENQDFEPEQKRRARPPLDPAKLKSGVQRIVEQRAQSYASAINERIDQTQQSQLAILSRIQRRDFEAELSRLGKGDLIDDVDKYIAENNITPAQLAMDGAYRVIAHAVVGARAFEQFSRNPNLPSSGGRNGNVETPEPEFDSRTVGSFNERYNMNLSADEISVLSKPVGSINDYFNYIKSRNRKA